MKHAVYAHYDGTTILMEVFDTYEDAEKYMETPQYVTFDDEEKYVVYIDEMWVEPYDEIPFADPMTLDDLIKAAAVEDELPF